MKAPYQFSVLRFVYDPLTTEFVNVGIVVYSPSSQELRAQCTTHYRRISTLFQAFDGLRLRQTLRYVQDRLNDVGSNMVERLKFRSSLSLNELLSSVLPVDDSSLQFASGGVGLTDDIDKTTGTLFQRYVEKYAAGQEIAKRLDEDIWRTFRGPLDRHRVTAKLIPKKIVGRNYEYEFDRAWKNGSWHLYEPVSFDLVDGSAIREKANRWVGRATALEDSPDLFKLYLLLGKPTDDRLLDAFRKAENMLNRMPVPHEFIRESEAESFATGLAVEIDQHEKSAA